MSRNKKIRLICILFPVIIGGISGFLNRKGMSSFSQLNKPPLSPPAWAFPVVWTVLYLMMGTASWLVISSNGKREQVRRALFWYGLQLAVNVLWPVFFFSLGWYLFSFFWLFLLACLILTAANLFSRLSSAAAWLLVPYLIWTVFAGYLNLGIFLLN